MPKQRKIRTIVAPVSSLIVATADDLAAYGTPAYDIVPLNGGERVGTIYNNAGVFDVSQLGPVPDINETIRISIAANIAAMLDDDGNDTLRILPDTDDMPGTVFYDATDPDIRPPTVTPSEPGPVQAGADLANVANDRALARAAAARAVAAFYSGKSLPFKSAHDLKRKAAINFALNRDASARSAALLAAILTYCDVQPGTLEFVRGSGRVPGRLLGHTGADADRLYPAGPESGGLSNCIPDRIEYVSGALAGPGCENAIFRIVYNGALANLRAHNTKQSDDEHLFSAAIGLLDLLNAPVPVNDPADTTGAAPDNSVTGAC